jgi:hypothetical protein
LQQWLRSRTLADMLETASGQQEAASTDLGLLVVRIATVDCWRLECRGRYWLVR